VWVFNQPDRFGVKAKVVPSKNLKCTGKTQLFWYRGLNPKIFLSKNGCVN